MYQSLTSLLNDYDYHYLAHVWPLTNASVFSCQATRKPFWLQLNRYLSSVTFCQLNFAKVFGHVVCIHIVYGLLSGANWTQITMLVSSLWSVFISRLFARVWVATCAIRAIYWSVRCCRWLSTWKVWLLIYGSLRLFKLFYECRPWPKCLVNYLINVQLSSSPHSLYCGAFNSISAPQLSSPE